MTCADAIEANIIKGKLESEGVPCFLTNKNSATIAPHHFMVSDAGVQVFIDERDLGNANEILKSNTGSERDLVCPDCGSANIGLTLGKNKMLKVLRIFFSLLVMMPKGKSQYSYFCKDCKKEFE